MWGLLGSWNALCGALSPSSDSRNLSSTCGKSALPAPVASSTRFDEVTEPHTKHVPRSLLVGVGAPAGPGSGRGGGGGGWRGGWRRRGGWGCGAAREARPGELGGRVRVAGGLRLGDGRGRVVV